METYRGPDAGITPASSTIPRPVRIDDDRWVSIRPIDPPDADALADFYAGLSPESMRRRFLSCADQPVAALARRFTERQGEGFVGILREPGPHDGAVVGHVSLHPDGHGSAEIAFAVADELQHRGIGSALLATSVLHARRSGLQRLTASFFAENAAMRRLLRRTGCAILSHEIDAGTEEISIAI